MKVYLESEVECTVDGVGLLEPGKTVEVNIDMFQLYHGVRPSEANFPKSVKVWYQLEDEKDEEVAE